jgi:hypothetical protein
MKRFLLLFVLALSLPAAASDEVQPLLECLRANIPESLRVQQVALITTGRDDKPRELRGTLFAMRENAATGGVRAMLRLDAPEHFKGAAYLVREDQREVGDGMYVYLPAVRRVRRITGSFADGALLGTDFSYQEFKLMLGAFGDGDVHQIDDETVGGRESAVLVLTPGDARVTRYTEIRAWIDRESCLPLRAEFREGDTLRKRYSADVEGLRSTNGHWYAAIATMEDLVEQSRTEVQVLGVGIGTQLPDRHFDPRLFHQAP